MSSKSITIEGSIHSISEVQTIGAKGFQKREAVILIEDGKYPQHIPVEIAGDKLDLLNDYRVGDPVSMEVNLRGRQWNGPNGTKTFLSLSVWKLNSAAPTHAAPATSDSGTPDGLPF